MFYAFNMLQRRDELCSRRVLYSTEGCKDTSDTCALLSTSSQGHSVSSFAEEEVSPVVVFLKERLFATVARGCGCGHCGS